MKQKFIFRALLLWVLLVIASVSTFATDITVASFTLPAYRATGTTATVRVYFSDTFNDSNGVTYIGGLTGSANFYTAVPCTVNLTTRRATCAPFVIPSTDDSRKPSVRASLILYDGTNRSRISDVYTNLRIPSTLGASVTLDQIVNFNNTAFRPLPDTYYTAAGTNAQIQQQIGNIVTPNASSTLRGISRLSVMPALSTNPIAVGTNDPRLTNWINVTGSPYNAVADGVTDATTAINAAIAATTSGVVYLPAGTYLMSGSLNIATAGVHLIGDGRGATIIKAASGFRTGDMIYITASNCSVENMTVSGGATMRTAGAGVHVNGPNGVGNVKSDCHIVDVDFDHQFDSILLDGNQYRAVVDRVFIDYPSPGGTGITINTVGNQGVSQFISNVMMDGKTSVAADQSFAAIRVRSTGDFTLRSVSTILFQNGLVIDPSVNNPNGIGVAAGFVSDSLFDTHSQHGILIKPTKNAVVGMVHFVDSWTAGNGQGTGGSTTAPGIEIDGTNGLARSVQFTAHRSYANAGAGVYVHGSQANNIFFDGGDFSSNGTLGIVGSGLKFDTGASYFAVRNLFAGNTPWYGSSQVTGVDISSSTSNFIVSGNNLTGNVTNTLLDNSGNVIKTILGNIPSTGTTNALFSGASANYVITATGAFQDTGVSVTLPSPGYYQLIGTVRGSIQADPTAFLSAKLTLSTGGDVGGSETLLVQSPSSAAIQGTFPLFAAVNVTTAPVTVKLFAKREGTNFIVSQISSDANGRTNLSYTKIN